MGGRPDVTHPRPYVALKRGGVNRIQGVTNDGFEMVNVSSRRLLARMGLSLEANRTALTTQS